MAQIDPEQTLLTGEQGARLRHIVAEDGETHQIATAIDWISVAGGERLD